ncbi:protein S100-A13 isoform X1 [Enhydra lutris kenyoni]|uniref:Protein S100-A13 isoform X1 n=2 Tax=Enhydra lutris kenyoni TaxID=391180 RepID=A0A2Y9IDK4_ENHLU|nr:protein S100-A13 isoform X1 [Enhydra lutris kenyoni]
MGFLEADTPAPTHAGPLTQAPSLSPVSFPTMLLPGRGGRRQCQGRGGPVCSDSPFPPLPYRVLMAAEPLTELEAAIETVVTTFFTFAGQEGRKGSLSINEFRELATQQLPHLLKDVGSLDEKMKSLDVNQDSELKFHEYWRLIGELAREIRRERALETHKK